ncbi:Stp1/IreP family PP2C-type Ser/Thr phosphatase [Salisediminibacterium beveridgei]|uniref:Protein serine/threonine phosphatase PrpC, regulation of stationary phase n=1 Tax=Salisediminibacterium beveridgei TaxID=632773 RepID=A0A1D7QW50_9BACI|nr:Stp1/IreP family PP2C-type Ser/Thr phosphatase [Salisediminibacterium beveridgei]AOM83237.1 Protein serine/threonine phosphatase PrpC, regulation of stationary phase [Salisediminibacterium beveridgei]
MNGLYMTDRGRVRPYNEDSGSFTPHGEMESHALAVVADGMGGHSAGDVASAMSVRVMEYEWDETSKMTQEEWLSWLEKAMLYANKKVYEYAQQHKEYEGMGTTLTATVCVNDHLIVGNIGDSRVYHYSYDKDEFHQVTMDNSVSAELYRAGQITLDEAENHPRKHMLTKAVGTNPGVSADIYQTTWESGDRLLLCTDGLTNKLSDEMLHTLLKDNEDLQTAGQLMIDKANELGGEDNISLVIAEHDGERGRN